MVNLTAHLRFSLSLSRLSSNSKKAEAKTILAECRSTLSGHKELRMRPRLSEEKIEFISWDPWVQRLALYKEHKKVKSVRDDKHSREVEIVALINAEKDKKLDTDDALHRPFYHTKVEQN
uniref:Mitochondrial 39S ribosomal protein L33 n=1 Tax=Caligus clemensi TaxID=344056 RepID=C1C1F3_CALCM|nr:Mitochondrial 39S ribosomal protein L33 [Caligus clemensi]